MSTLKRITVILLTIFVFFSCSESEVGSAEEGIPVAGETLKESGFSGIARKKDSVVQPVPAVILRDDSKVWGNEGSELSSESLAILDYGTEVTYVGVDQDFSTGKNEYSFSKIRTSDGVEGWVYTYRIGKNCLSAVVVEAASLYSKPSLASPLNRHLPSSQIVAVSLEQGEIDGFAQVKFSYYNEKGSISAPETGYVSLDLLSSSPEDIEVSKLVLKAFRTPEQKDAFLGLTFTQKTVFRTTGILNEGMLYSEPSLDSDASPVNATVEILAINPHVEGEAQPWYLAMNSVGELVWVYAGLGEEPSVTLPTSIKDSITEHPAIPRNSNYTGSGVKSVNVYPGLSLRELLVNEQGIESVSRFDSLEMGETVYSMEVKEIGGKKYVNVELPGNTSGWASASYIAQNARPAVILDNDVYVYKEAKLTALSSLRLMKNQVVAVYDAAEAGFLKISYVSEDEKLHSEYYIQSSMVALSYSESDLMAALLFYKIQHTEDQTMKDALFESGQMLSSYLSDEWYTLVYGAEEEVVIEDAEVIETEETVEATEAVATAEESDTAPTTED
jgi:hypothetical protein